MERFPSFMQDGRLVFTAEKREPGFLELALRRQNLDGGDYHPLYSQRATIGYEQSTGVVELSFNLSTSGNSENLLRGLDEATRRGLLTVGIAGYDGGQMAEIDSLDYLFVAPSSSVHRIQEAQTTVYHVLWELTVRALGDAR